jgi:ElaB/YqjD/DUF883 family membrane-anchored ribosome-binding protein
MGEESGRLVGSDPMGPGVEGDDSSNLTSGLIFPNTFSGSVQTGAPYSEGDPELYSNEFASGMPPQAFDDATDTETDDELEQTRAQIEQTRAELSTTIDAIQEKLSPQNLAQQAKDTVKDATVGKAQEMVSNAGETASDLMNNAGSSAKGFGANLIETVKANPVPAAIAGIGLGWLLMSGRNQSTQGTAYSNQYNSNPQGYSPGRSGRYNYGSNQQTNSSPLGDRISGAQDKVGGLAGQAQDKVGGFAGQAQDKASNVAGQVQDTAGHVAGQVQDTAGQLADTAQYGAQRAQGAFQQALHSNPLAVGVAAVAVGAAIGLSIPETEKENQLLGETRDGVMQQAQHTVQEKAQQVQTVAQEAVGAAKDAAQQSADKQGLTQK